MSIRCLNPSCNRWATARGLCSSCYCCAHRLVRLQQTTWQQLEAQHKCLPKQVHNGTSSWLLNQSA